jgi:hypothetical protein
MATDDKKTKSSSGPETGSEKEATAKKKDESQPKDKSEVNVNPPKAGGSEKVSSGYSRGEGQKPVSKAYKDNWNSIYAKKKKR